jgi:hypothetical protein
MTDSIEFETNPIGFAMTSIAFTTNPIESATAAIPFATSPMADETIPTPIATDTIGFMANQTPFATAQTSDSPDAVENCRGRGDETHSEVKLETPHVVSYDLRQMPEPMWMSNLALRKT